MRGVSRRTRLLADRFADRIREGEIGRGEAIGEIRIPRVGLEMTFVEGTDTGSLQRGPGHYPETSVPGQRRTVGIAGHRTTYLAPFRHIDDLRRQDEVMIEMPYADFTFEVSRTRVVEPADVQIVRDVGRERLVLTACHPLYSAAQRYAVFARLERVNPVPGAGRT